MSYERVRDKKLGEYFKVDGGICTIVYSSPDVRVTNF